ncbi:MAG: DEAD/DEAH box helicase [Clostridiales bacterium]|nr:DEAD/DEAH box helicase [Clostridiales bacterium]
MNFQDCHLIDPIVKALTEQGYTQPTAIQAGAIPPALEGRDVLGCARTGTGKTCAFAAPILQRLSQNPVEGRPIRALVLTPTRELAIQNQECFVNYGKYLNVTSVVIFGGVGQAPQVEAIQKGADVLVATPGRLADLYQQGYLDLSKLEIFVLDEADRMLDMGFIHDVKKILQWLPKKKQTLFFSATMPEEITQLVNSLLYKPVRVAVDPVNSTVDAIRQQVYLVDRVNKTKLLVSLLEEQELSSVLVFTRTKHGANKVSKDLQKAGVSAAAIHGNKSQTARQEALAGFKAGNIRVLVATDIAARGLDIEDLACVVNYNLPEVPETYVHRIGRTGRAGRGGLAIAFCDFNEQPLLKDIEKLMGKKVPQVKDHPWPMQNFDPPAKDKGGKVRNPEDEEARAAARELAKARREANAARQTKSAPQETASAPTESAPAPEKSKTKKKGKKAQKPAQPEPVVPIPDLLPKREEQPIEPARTFDSSDILHRKYKRPEKKVIPSLSSVSLLPNVELKETFGSRTVDTSRKLNTPARDATDRLFSDRKEIPEKYRPERREEPEATGKAGKKSGKKPSGGKNTRQQPESVPQKQEGRQKPAAQKQTGGKSASQKQNSGKKAQQQPPKSAAAQRQTTGGKSRQQHPANQGKKTRIPPRTERPERQKDSTEQKSLMKPYYLSDRRKG